jgi:vacuolar protein sorting-associated protein 16
MAVLHYAAVNEREKHRLLTDADKIAKKFRVSENLRLLSDSKAKPPIGFKPFARAAIKGEQSVTEIMRYIERVALPEERYGLFCEAGLWKRALEEAAKLRDERRIIDVKTRCNNSEVQMKADQILAKLA